MTEVDFPSPYRLSTIELLSSLYLSLVRTESTALKSIGGAEVFIGDT